MTDTISLLPVDQLQPSPFNPRRTMPQASLQELADDIRHQGVLSPLLVRPICHNPLRDDLVDGYQVVFGHRRLQAAQLAGLAEVPCMVRALSNEEARTAQLSENLSREDVHPIEEAEGFQALMDEHGRTADQLCEQFGISRSKLYGRLKLLQAAPKVREACLAGRIGADTALLLARLRTPKLQEKALQLIAARNLDVEDGGAKSFRRIRELLREAFTLDLTKRGGCLFDPEDDTLLPSAGVCSACPKRVGNAPEYSDLAEDRGGRHNPAWLREGAIPDHCTDPDCFAAKKAAHLAREAERLTAAGKTVITGAKARAAVSADGQVKGAYVQLTPAVKKALKAAEKKGRGGAVVAPAPKTVTIQDPRSGKLFEAVPADQLPAAAKAAAPATRNDRQSYAQQEAAAKARRAAELQRAEVENRRRLALLVAVREAAAEHPRSTLELQLIAAQAVQGVGWQGRPLLAKLWGCRADDALVDQIPSLSADELGRLLLDCALVGDCPTQPYELQAALPADAPLMQLAQAYGLDVARVQADATAQDPNTAELPLDPAPAAGDEDEAVDASAAGDTDDDLHDGDWPYPGEPTLRQTA